MFPVHAQASPKVDLSKRWKTLYWMVALDWQSILWEKAVGSFQEVLAASMQSIQVHAPGAPGLQPISDPHVTLFWPSTAGTETSCFQEQLEKVEGREVSVTVQALCWDESLGLIALRVSLDETCAHLCQNLHPHITVARLPGVAAKLSNDMLLRQAEGDTSVKQIPLQPFTVTGLVQRQLSAESLAFAAASASALPEGNPVCQLGLAATAESVDVWATYDASARFRRISRALGALICPVSEPLLHCKGWPPKLRGKMWLTFHERPLSSQSMRALEQLQKQSMFQTLHVAVAYFQISEGFLRKTVAEMQQELSHRLLGTRQGAFVQTLLSVLFNSSSQLLFPPLPLVSPRLPEAFSTLILSKGARTPKLPKPPSSARPVWVACVGGPETSKKSHLLRTFSSAFSPTFSQAVWAWRGGFGA